VTINGDGLDAQNHLFLFRNAFDCPLSGDVLEDAVASTATSSGLSQTFSWSEGSIAGEGDIHPGWYALCWSQSLISKSQGSYALVGRLDIIGPLPGNLLCMLGTACTMLVHGFGFTEAGKVWISKGTNCVPEQNAQFPGWKADGPTISLTQTGNIFAEWGVASGGIVGDDAMVCWRSEPSTPSVIIGQFMMQGPTQAGKHECILGETCTVTLEGVGFSLRDKASVHTGDDCTALDSQGLSFRNATALLRAGSAAQFSFGVIAAWPQPQTLTHMLCWLAAGETEARPITVAPLQFVGPREQVIATCTLGMDCIIKLVGYGFSALDRVRAVGRNNGGNCVVSQSEANVFEESPSGRQSTIISGSTEASFHMGMALSGVGQSYHVCWGDAFAAVATITAGQVEIQGPIVGMAHRCSLGETCKLLLRGAGLATSNRIEFRLQGKCEDEAVPLTGMPSQLSGSHMPTGDGQKIEFDMQVLGAGYLGRPYIICWQHSSESALVNVGTLMLEATDTYLNAAAQTDGLSVRHWVSGHAILNSPSLDLSLQVHRDAIVSALASLLGAAAGDITLTANYNRRLEVFSLEHQVSVRFVAAAVGDPEAKAMAQRVRTASSGGPESQAFISEINRMAPDANILSASFEEPWLDVAIIAEDDEAEVLENPWGLPWWPRTRMEMFISGVICCSLVICMCACSWWWICRRFQKRTPVSSPHGMVLPTANARTPPPRSSPSRQSSSIPATSRTIGRSVDVGDPRFCTNVADVVRNGLPQGRTIHGAQWIPSLRDQNAAVATMVDMGFEYQLALEALRANNFSVQQAVEALS